MLRTLSQGEHSQKRPLYPLSQLQIPQMHSPLFEQISPSLVHCSLFSIVELSSQLQVSPTKRFHATKIYKYIRDVTKINFRIKKCEKNIACSYQTNQSRICIYHTRWLRVHSMNFLYFCNRNRTKVQLRSAPRTPRTLTHHQSPLFVSSET